MAILSKRTILLLAQAWNGSLRDLRNFGVMNNIDWGRVVEEKDPTSNSVEAYAEALVTSALAEEKLTVYLDEIGHKTVTKLLEDINNDLEKIGYNLWDTDEGWAFVELATKSTHDQIITKINITPTQGYAGDSIVLEAWASKPDTAIHLDVVDENGKRRINTGQVVFDKPFKHVLTLSKHDFEPGTYSAVFYTTDIKENKTGTFEFLGSTSKQVAKPKQEDEKLSKTIKQEKKWDVFISHATEDKTVATPLAEKLREVGLNVWYDQYVLRWGDSLMDSINTGLKDSIFGIVILSKTFFKKQWTKTELKGLMALANDTGEKKILPLLYKITHKEITDQYPILADIVARSWGDGLDKLAKEVKEMVDEKKNLL